MNIYNAILPWCIFHLCMHTSIIFYGMCVLQCQMLMVILFDVDGLSQLSMSVVVCARCFQLRLTRLVT